MKETSVCDRTHFLQATSWLQCTGQGQANYCVGTGDASLEVSDSVQLLQDVVLRKGTEQQDPGGKWERRIPEDYGAGGSVSVGQSQHPECWDFSNLDICRINSHKVLPFLCLPRLPRKVTWGCGVKGATGKGQCKYLTNFHYICKS